MPSLLALRAHLAALHVAVNARAVRDDLIARARARLALRATSSYGRGARCFGSVFVENRGAIRIGDDFAVGGHLAAVRLLAERRGIIGIGDNVTLEYGSLIAARSLLSIGSRVRIGPHCTISDSVEPLHLADDNRDTRAIMIGNDVWLGARVTIMPGVRIGDRAVIAAGSFVHEDVADDALAAGRPATILRVAGREAPASTRTAHGRGHAARSNLLHLRSVTDRRVD